MASPPRLHRGGSPGRNDNEIRAAHGVASHHGCRAFQIDNDEYGLECRLFYCVDDGVFRGRGNHGELCGFSWAIGHWVSGRLGSASIMVTEPPWLASSVASSTAAVDLPTPPWGLRTQWLAYNVFAEYKIR